MKKHILLIICIGVGMLSAYAQDSKLQDYLKQTAENNPQLKASFDRYMASLEQVPQVGALPDPELTFGYFIQPMEILMGNQRGQVSIMQMFPWFGMLKTQKSEAAAMARANYEAFRNNKNELYFQVKTAYYELYRIEKEISFNEKNLALLETIERVAVTKYEGESGSAATQKRASNMNQDSKKSGGSMSNMGGTDQKATTSNQMSESSMSSTGMAQKGLAEIYRINIEKMRIQNTIDKLKAERSPSVAKLNQLMDRPLSTPIDLTDDLSISPLFTSEVDWSNNPMINMLEAEQEATLKQEEMAKYAGRPMFGLGINYMILSPRMENNMEMGGKNMIMPMATLSLPIFRGKYKAMSNQAKYKQQAIEQDINNTKGLLEVQWQQYSTELNNLERDHELYNAQYKLAEKTYEVMLSSYISEGVGFDEILEIQRELLDYQIKQNTTVTQHWQIKSALEMLLANEIDL